MRRCSRRGEALGYLTCQAGYGNDSPPGRQGGLIPGRGERTCRFSSSIAAKAPTQLSPPAPLSLEPLRFSRCDLTGSKATKHFSPGESPLAGVLRGGSFGSSVTIKKALARVLLELEGLEELEALEMAPALLTGDFVVAVATSSALEAPLLLLFVAPPRDWCGWRYLANTFAASGLWAGCPALSSSSESSAGGTFLAATLLRFVGGRNCACTAGACTAGLKSSSEITSSPSSSVTSLA
eukprot:CAMPEP_0180750782 /NCGR_PEP_ID=MMETSP1038_2-20121128/31295_1 /TAXON_ID=632150 /ORGANISM="Azadinium spinosum, Strain 3D9" /LENGTH=237 /DNA_ID=CAMNT_0022784549 /DNA_START=116 /DNA_END=830 /DNA_ORIENTATION=+